VRPVNLIPPEDRRGDRAPMRAGATSYVVLAALGLGLVMMIAVALTSKQISDRESEKQSLESELTAATERAQSLSAFATFRDVQEKRTATVASLAQSRFDWERVLRELALVIPSDVWLLKMSGSVNPAVQLEQSAEVQARDNVEGPALEIVGCAPNQDSVAGFVAALEDIDGVTRVGLASSSQSEQEGASAVSSAAGTGQAEDCRTRSFIYQFEIVVAFDAVPTPEAAAVAPGAPVAPGTDPSSLAGSTATQTAEAQQAANMIPGG
jgi:Tfp pilus assembly protein PilN